IASISQGASSVISLSVGQEIRVRDNQKVGENDKLRPIDKKAANPKESTEIKESQISKNTPEQIKEVVTRLQTTLQNIEPKIELSVDKELQQVIVRIFDKDSGELIRQIPSEQVLELDRFFAGQSGLFVEEEI
ncbi:MAG: flagellar protein FlaG, partial [Nitrospirota bacterium]|nr:flagellar protein FlaG [Nitrospirota bacterium]